METLTPIRFVVYGKPRVLVKDALTRLLYDPSEALDDSEFDSAPLSDPPGGSVGNFAVTL